MDWTCLEAKGWRQIKNSSLLSHGGRGSNMDEASLGGLQTIGDQLQGDESRAPNNAYNSRELSLKDGQQQTRSLQAATSIPAAVAIAAAAVVIVAAVSILSPQGMSNPSQYLPRD